MISLQGSQSMLATTHRTLLQIKICYHRMEYGSAAAGQVAGGLSFLILFNQLKPEIYR